jgi:glycosyltransferase involved in cell wall biosynthesis
MVVHPGVDTVRFTDAATQAGAGTDMGTETTLDRHRGGHAPEERMTSRQMHVISVGRVSAEKNPALFIRTAALINRARGPGATRFTVVGDGRMRRRMERLAVQLNVSHALHFTGHMYGELPRLLASADVFVTTSTFPETFALVNVEAMAAGIPVVNFAVGGMTEYMHPHPHPHARSYDGADMSTMPELGSSEGTANAPMIGATEAPGAAAVGVLGRGEASPGEMDWKQRLGMSVGRVCEAGVVPSGPTPAATARAVVALLEDDTARAVLGRRGRALAVDRFSAAISGDMYAELYGACGAGRAGGGGDSGRDGEEGGGRAGNAMRDCPGFVEATCS